MSTPLRSLSERMTGLLLCVCVLLFLVLVWTQYRSDALVRRSDRGESLEQSASLVERALRADPTDPDHHHILARMFYLMADRSEPDSPVRAHCRDQAEREYVQAIRNAPTSSSFHLGLASIRLLKLEQHVTPDQTARAERSLQLATYLAPYDHQPHYFFATYLVGQNRLSEALPRFRDAIHARPHEEVIKNSLKTLATRTSDYELLRQIVPEGDSLAHFCLGMFIEDRWRRWKDSRPEVESAIKLDPSSERYRDYFFMLCLRHGDFEAARNEIAYRVSNGHPSTSMQLRIARELLNRGRLEEALQECHEMERSRPIDPRVLQLKAEIQRRKGDLLEAIRTYEMAIKRNPRNAENYFQLGDLYRRHGNLYRAAELFSEAVHHNPEGFDYWRVLGETYLQMELLDKAVSAFERCKVIAPERIGPYLYLGGLYAKKENWLQSALEYGEALKLDRENAEAMKGFLTAQSSIP